MTVLPSAQPADPPCTIRTVVGDPEPFSGDGGPATEASLFGVWGVAAAPDGAIYVADSGNRRIRKIDTDGIITTVAGTGQHGYTGDGGPAVAATLEEIFYLAVGPDGSVYFSDGAARVRRIRPDGIIELVAGNGERTFNGDSGWATEIAVAALGLDFDREGNLYIADTGSHRVRKVTPSGELTTIAGSRVGGWEGSGFGGDGGPATEARLDSPYDVAVAPDGSILITDLGNYRVRRVRPDGIIETIAGTGEYGYDFESPGPIPALEFDFNWISSLAADDAGIVYIRDGSQILQLANGVITQVMEPAIDIAIDPEGRIVSTLRESVQRREPDGAVSTIAGRSRFLPVDAVPADRFLGGAMDLAEDSSGNLYFIADNTVFRRTVSGIIERVGGPWGATPPATLCLHAITIGPSDDVYVANQCANRVFRIDQAGLVSVFAGNGATGIGDNLVYHVDEGMGGPATDAPVPRPRALAADRFGNVYITASPSPIGSRIFRVSTDGVIEPVGAGLNLVRHRGSRDNPLAVDSAGNVYWGLYEDYGIAQITRSGSASVLSGTPGVLDYLESLAVDETGNLYVALSGHLYRRSPDGVLVELARYAQEASNYGEGEPLANSMTSGGPAVILDHEGNLVISDTLNSRIRHITSPAACPGLVRPILAVRGHVNAASFQARAAVAPGEIVTLFGVNLGPVTLFRGEVDENGRLSSEVGGVRVLFDGIAAPIIHASAFQTTVVVPYEVSGSTSMVVEYQGVTSETFRNLPVVDAQPGIFTLDGSGLGQGAIVNEDGSINGPSNQAPRGSVILIYATGEGLSEPRVVTGQIVEAGELPRPVLPITVRFGDVPGIVRYAGGAVGMMAGVIQINAEIPPNAPIGDAVPLILQVGDKQSQPQVTVAIR